MLATLEGVNDKKNIKIYNIAIHQSHLISIHMPQ